MSKLTLSSSGRWTIFIIVWLLSACSASTPVIATTPTPTPQRIGQLAESNQRISRASPTPSVTATATLAPTSTPFTGLIPTVASATPTVRSSPIPPTNTPSSVATFVLGGTTHTVIAGDSLTLIANRYRVTVEQLLDANGMYRSQVLQVGQQLAVPIPTLTPTVAPTLDRSVRGALAQQIILTNQPPLPPSSVNDLRYREFFNLSDDVVNTIREVFARGQVFGRDPNAFTRIGDSTIEPPHFFYRFDEDDYHLGDYHYLQSTIDYFAGSFAHDSVAVRRGLHVWSVFDPMWSPQTCDDGEHMLECEFRLHNPSFIIIRLGTNDIGQEDLTRENFEGLIQYAMEQGVIPILGTKADRYGGASDSVNTIIREMARQYDVPLWDFDLVANTLPTKGLGRDNIHLSFFYEHDWRMQRGFTTGHGLHNLTGLIVLDELLQVLHDD